MMLQAQPNATRMELLRVRRRLATATRGHALLKDKLDGLMQEFLRLVADYKAARRSFDEQFCAIVRRFLLAELVSRPGAVASALLQSRAEAELTVRTRTAAGVRTPHFETKVHRDGGHSLLETSAEFDQAVQALVEFLPKIVALAELEHSVWLFLAELERTRRRVNALEYILIPSLKDTVRYIRAKLDEMERANTVRLMKVKDLRLAELRREERRRAR